MSSHLDYMNRTIDRKKHQPHSLTKNSRAPAPHPTMLDAPDAARSCTIDAKNVLDRRKAAIYTPSFFNLWLEYSAPTFHFVITTGNEKIECRCTMFESLTNSDDKE